MFPGSDINSDQRTHTTPFQFGQTNDFHKNQPLYSETKQFFNAKNGFFDLGSDTSTIPHHLRLFFETENKPIFEAHTAKNSFVPTSQNSVPSHSTIDSRRHSHTGQAEPIEGVRYASFNTLLNQSNDFALGKNLYQDLNNSNLSNKESKNPSINNMSRDSGFKDLNTSNSRRNLSSRSNVRTKKNYQVNINDDIKLIERIDTMLNQITANHNKMCPFCNRVIDIRKSNFQNVSAFTSNSTKKYYLTHFDCYLKSNSVNPNQSTKLMSLASITKAAINSQADSLSLIDSTHFLRLDRRAYFITIEGYHPISSQILFKIEKSCFALEHSVDRHQLLYLNLDSKNTTLFEPSSYVVPYSEFRLSVNVYLTHSNDDAYNYEFITDFSQVKVSADQEKRFAEAYYPPEGNGIVLGTQVVYDPNSELSSHLNYKISLDTSFNTTAGSAAKPDFGKNVFLILKQVLINLPLKRMDKQNQENSMCLLPESLLSDSSFLNTQQQQQEQQPSLSKKQHTKLHLNTNAPLFCSFNTPPDQSSSQNFFLPPTQPSSNFNQGFEQLGSSNFGAHSQLVKPGENSNVFASSVNSYFNTPLFSQNFTLGHSESNQYEQHHQPQPTGPFGQQHQPISQSLFPPGLNSFGESDDYNKYGTHSQLQEQRVNNYRNKGLHVDTKLPGYTNHVIMEASAENTPSEVPFGENDMPNLERNKSRGPNNLFKAVVSGRKNDNSITNSPCLSAGKLRNRYFGDFSTPGSDYENSPATPKIDNYDSQEFDDMDEMPTGEETIENFRVEDHIGHLVEFAKTYNGSRLLQKFFPRANQDEVELVIDEIENNVDELMLDPYANYMFQTLAQSCSADQRYRLLQKIAPSMVKVACDRKGTHSLQAIVALVNRDVEEKLIINALQGNIVNLAFDSQGTHLLQKLIVSISLANIWFIYQPLIERFDEVVSHSFGLCVLKQLMTKLESNAEYKGQIINLLYEHFEDLIQNPYGNYALQHALEIWPNDCNIILEKAADKIVQYSNQKFSSNVIEKCIMIAPAEIRKKYLMEVVRSERIAELMKNKYGNYVLLKILSTADVEGKQLMIQQIAKNLNAINVQKHRNRWAQFIEENPLKIPAQTLKPSIFKNLNFNDNTQSNSTKDQDGQNSPGSAGQKKKFLKEEKSQFYYESGKPSFQRNLGFEDSESYNSPDLAQNARRGGETANIGSGNKKNKNTNQKFYSDKGPHHMNKGGYSSFY